MNKQKERPISADKLLEWLKIREGEAYTNADQVFNPSFLLGKADAFNDVVEYVKSGHSEFQIQYRARKDNSLCFLGIKRSGKKTVGVNAHSAAKTHKAQ